MKRIEIQNKISDLIDEAVNSLNVDWTQKREV